MKTARVGVCLAFLLAWTIARPSSAQDLGASDPVRPDTSPDTFDFFGPRNVMLRSDIGDGVGYAKGFQTFSAFQSMVISPNELILFANPRGIVTYLGNLSANAGAGFRWYDDEVDRILGGSFWYDHDNTGPKTYDQFGISLESLGKYVDFRVNGYMPTNDNRTMLQQYYNGNNQFFGNFIGLGLSTLYTTPLKGGDFEVGGLLPGIGNVGIRPYVGGYYYQGEGTGAAYGVRARLEALITQDFWGQVAVTNDRLFGTNVTCAFTWYFGSGQQARWFQRIPVVDRLYQQVERQYRIAAYEELYNSLVTALRAGGTGGSGGPVGTPIYVVHVDNSAPAGGDGTVEHPLSQLPTHTNSNVDIVFVHRGTGTSVGYNHGITLNNYQRLLGQGVQHDFTSLQGTYLLPGYVPGPLPVLTNPAGNVVTLASYNEVSGFNIRNASGHGIYGNGITNFNINNVHIDANLGSGIQLVNATGYGQVFDSSMNNNAGEGLRIDNEGGDLTLRVNNVDAQTNLTGVSLNGTGFANYNVILQDVNTSNSTRNGIDVALTANSTIYGTFDRISSNNNNRQGGNPAYGDGLRVTADNSQVSLTVQNSTFDGNLLNGTSFTGTNGSFMDIYLLNNSSTINGNQLNGVYFNATNSNVNLTMRNNVVNNNNGFGVFAQATNGSFNLIADDNVIRNNHGAGIAYSLRDTATGAIEIDRNVITGTLTPTSAQDSTKYLGQAIDIRLQGSTTLSHATATLNSGEINGNIIGNLVNPALGNVGGGIFAYADEQTTLKNLTIGTSGAGNLIANNGGDGIFFRRRNEAVIDNVVIDSNNITLNAGHGIHLAAENSPNDDSDYTIQNNTITQNAFDGILLHVEADAILRADIARNLIDHNGQNGIQTTELSASSADLRRVLGHWTSNTITNNFADGISLDGAIGKSSEPLTIGDLTQSSLGNLISKNGGAGINQTGAGFMAVGYNEISQNGAGGIILNPASTNGYTINQNYIHDNTGDGLQLLASGPFTITMNAAYNVIRDNSGRGVNILNRPNAGTLASNTSVTLDHNYIIGNKGIGVYVVNTSSTDQSITAAATDTLNSNGDIRAIPRLTFVFTNNQVEGNGINTTFGASGLVLRVGTSDGDYTYTNDGGFFSEGRGGVGATITGNTFHGNLGDDVYIASFVSTLPPGATQGQWDATTFNITEYHGDPLARLDLVFNNNAADSYNVNNLGAFYDDTDGTFKSRTTTATDPGPFESDSRQRNATRLGARFGLPPATPGGASNSFLYPGIGQSTFRLLSAPTGNTGPGGVVNPFIIDAFYTSPASANGITSGPELDFMPYGWNLLGGTPRPQ